MKALVATDGSAGSFAALELTGRLLSPERDQLALYYAAPAIKLAGSAPDAAVLEQAQHALIAAVLDASEAHLQQTWRGHVARLVGHALPKQDLLPQATSWGAGLIAVGARGLGPLESLLVGSVSRHVVHAAHVPALVARPRRSDAAAPLRVLVACEGIEGDDCLGRLLGQLTWPPGTVGRAISVVQPMFAGHVPAWLEPHARSPEVEAMAAAWTAEHDAELKSRAGKLAGFCAALPALFAAEPPLIVEGHPADQILAAIEREAIDLVVVGTHRGGAVSRLLLGSTSEAVLSHAGCSVLVVRASA